MAGEAARSSYKSTTGQPPRLHDEYMSTELDKILKALNHDNYEPFAFAYQDSNDDPEDSVGSPISPVGAIPKPSRSRHSSSSRLSNETLSTFISPSRMFAVTSATLICVLWKGFCRSEVQTRPIRTSNPCTHRTPTPPSNI